MNEKNELSLATRKTSHNARGRLRKLSRGKSQARSLAREDTHSDNDDEPLKSKSSNTEESNEINEDHDIDTNNMKGKKGIHKLLQKHQGRPNITPDYSEIRSFQRVVHTLDPEEPLREALIDSYESRFDSWLFHIILDSNKNLLLYGIGSKTDLIRRFSRRLHGQDVIFLDGLKAGSEYNETDKLIKILLDHICHNILKQPELLTRYSVLNTCVSDILDELCKFYDRNLSIGDAYQGMLSSMFRNEYYCRTTSTMSNKSKRSINSKDQSNSSMQPLNPRESSQLISFGDAESDEMVDDYDDNLTSSQIATNDAPPLKRRTIVPVLNTNKPNLDKSKFAKTSWKGRYRYAHPKLYILIDNITGPAIRSDYSQLILSRLASCSAVSIIASTEHINTSLLWTNEMLQRFNWIYEHVPTFERHTVTEDFVLFPNQQSSAVKTMWGSGQRTLISLLTSLTDKHRELLELIADETISQSNTKSSTNDRSKKDNVTIERLLQRCKDKLILRTESELMNMMKELIDQQTIKLRERNVDMAITLARDIIKSLGKQS